MAGKASKGKSGNWFPVPNALLLTHGEAIGAAGIAVYCALSLHANDRGKCWPSRQRIAALTGLCLSVVVRTIQRLERRGLVTVARSRGRKPSVYTLNGVPDTPLPESNGVGDTPLRCTGYTVNGVGDTPEQDTLNKTYEQESARRKQTFEEFLAEYPPHRKGDWRPLWRVWKEVATDEATVAAIMGGLRRWKASKEWTKQAGKYVPGADRFLNERRWEAAPAGRGTKYEYQPGMGIYDEVGNYSPAGAGAGGG